MMPYCNGSKQQQPLHEGLEPSSYRNHHERAILMRQEKQSIHPWGTRGCLGTLVLTVAVVGFAFGCGSETWRVELTVSDHNPTGTAPAQAVDDWAEQVTKQTGGRLRLAVYHDGVLLKGNEAYQGVQSGIADVGYYVLNRTDGFELNSAMELPFMGWPDRFKTAQMYLDLLDHYPAMKAEWRGLRIIGVMMMPGTHLHNVVRDIRTPADLSRVKTMGAESLAVDAARAAGAIALELDVAQMAPALADGTISAVISDFSTLSVFNTLQTLYDHTIFGEGGINMSPALIIMNNDVFDSLPSDMQNIVATSGSFFTEKLYALDGSLQADSIAQAEALNHNFVQLTSEEIAVWSSLVKQPVHNTWIATCEAIGLPGQAVYDDVLSRIQAATSP
jgi:TRAP-type transport system periplasmic protein